MDLLGKSLEDLLKECRGKFNLKTVLHVAVQMIERIKVVHEERIIHRDIKPDNFMTGANEKTKNTIHIIDFGLAKCYKDRSGEHIPFIEGKSLTGTARYASINTHVGYEQSRRDDLESIGHVLLYFLKGSLPWQGLPGKTNVEKYANIKKKKKEVSVSDLCKGLPDEFKDFMNYCRNLGFTQDPDYNYIIGLFEGCMKKNDIDAKTPDFIWNQNRLALEKEEMKKQMLNVINKKKKTKDDTGV